MNTYSMWGLSENINAFAMLGMWVPTAVVWVLSGATNDDGVHWFFVVWCGIMHYVDMVRFVLVNIVKLISYSMYVDLHTIIEDQEYRAKVKAAREREIYD